MTLQHLPINELYDMYTELQQAVDKEKGAALPALISVLEELHKRLATTQDREQLAKIKKQLVFQLVHYGAYMKTGLSRDIVALQKALMTALKYDRGNPLAYYRLGVLMYQRKNYLTAAVHFNNALKSNNGRHDMEYRLSAKQSYFSHQYLSNCALIVAEEAQSAINGATGKFSEMIATTENELLAQEYLLTTRSEMKLQSKTECEEMIHSSKGSFIIYFSDENQTIYYHQKEAKVSILQAKILITLMKVSSEDHPIGKMDFNDLFLYRNESGEVPAATLNLAITRLQKKLNSCLAKDVIHLKNSHYYYDQKLPYVIIQRADEVYE